MNIKYHQGGGDSLRRYKSKPSVNRFQNRSYITVCLLFAAMIFGAVLINRSLKPISSELAKSYGSSAVLDVINSTVSEYFNDGNVGYSDLVRLRYNSSGMVTSVEYNSKEINRIKIECLGLLNKNLSKLRTSKIKVPAGSLFNDLSLSGRGPMINIKLSESAVPDIEVLSTFESVGVNQSRHEIRMRVSAIVNVYLPPKSVEFTVTQDYVLAQTVIVGDVPSGYAQIE